MELPDDNRPHFERIMAQKSISFRDVQAFINNSVFSRYCWGSFKSNKIRESCIYEDFCMTEILMHRARKQYDDDIVIQIFIKIQDFRNFLLENEINCFGTANDLAHSFNNEICATFWKKSYRGDVDAPNQ